MTTKISQNCDKTVRPDYTITVQELATKLNVAPSTVRDTLSSAGLKYSKDVPVLELALALYQLAKRKLESKERLAAKERKEEAQAEKAEIEVAQLKGQLMFREDAGRLFADAYVRIRQTIDEESEIAPVVKERLSRKFLDIKLGE